mgnify:CR=1 FL=1
MGILSEIFSWWGGNTWSNRLYTAVRGTFVGSDDAGNRYFVQRRGVGPLGVPRRWVIYQNGAEASRCRPNGTAGCTTWSTPHPRKRATRRGPGRRQSSHEHDGDAGGLSPQWQHFESGRRPPATGDYKPWRPS